MKVLFFQTPVFAGGLMSLVAEIEELGKLDVESKLIIIGNEKKEITEYLEREKINYLYLKGYKWVGGYPVGVNARIKFYIKRLLNGLIYEKRINRIIDNFCPDCVYYNSFDNYLGITEAEKNGIPILWHAREFGKEDHNVWFYDEDFTKIKLKSISKCVCISKAIESTYRKNFPFLNTEVVYNGIDISEFPHKEQTPNNIIKLGVVGRISESKGQMLVLEVLNQNRQYQLLLAGKFENENYKKAFLSKIEKHNLSNNVKFMGYLDDTSTFYDEIDCLIVPSRSEAFGRVVVEAMLKGVVVIGSNSGGIPEIIKDGETGFIFDRTEAGLKHALERMEKSSTDEIVNNAYKVACSKYTSRINARNIYKILKEEMENNDHQESNSD